MHSLSIEKEPEMKTETALENDTEIIAVKLLHKMTLKNQDYENDKMKNPGKITKTF